MGRSYRDDRKWSDLMMPKVRELVGHDYVPATPEQDMKQATDLIVLNKPGSCMACRVRKPGYSYYWMDFTIRSHRSSGAETELSKILKGYGDEFFYGHADEKDNIYMAYVLDLHVFRYLKSNNYKLRSVVQANRDDGTFFIAYDLTSFPQEPNIIRATKMDDYTKMEKLPGYAA